MPKKKKVFHTSTMETENYQDINQVIHHLTKFTDQNENSLVPPELRAFTRIFPQLSVLDGEHRSKLIVEMLNDINNEGICNE